MVGLDEVVLSVGRKEQSLRYISRKVSLISSKEILSNVNKVIIDSDVSNSGVLPFLPLPEVNNKNRTIRNNGGN